MSTTVTEREAVMRERAAAQRALAYFDGTGRGADRAQQLAVEWFPLPKVQRPRVVSDQGDVDYRREFRCVDGALQQRQRHSITCSAPAAWRPLDGSWELTPAVVRFFADLLANPTELVDDDGFQGVRDGGDTT